MGSSTAPAGISAIEKTFDSHRRRNIDVAEVVAFARCFNRPIGWFFIPPPGSAQNGIEPLLGQEFADDLRAADLTTLVLGTPEGWQALLDRIRELTARDPIEPQAALRGAFGSNPREKAEQQLELRRQAIQSDSLKRLISREDEVIGSMARLLVELVKTTPVGMDRLRDTDRPIALDKATVAVLREHRKRMLEERMLLGSGFDDHGLVFQKPEGQWLNPDAVSATFLRRVTKYDLPYLSLHGLRHTWATLALERGIHPRVVQERFGHSTISITLGMYSHVGAVIHEEAAAVMGELMLREHS